MTATVQHILDILERIAPAELAQSWDNVGLLIGDPGKPVHGIILALDPTSQVLDQATRLHADLLITHHPLIFHPTKSIRTEQPGGRLISTAIRHNICVIGCHTNLDAASGGVSDILARRLGLEKTRPLDPTSSESAAASCGLGRIGEYPVPLTPDDFIGRLRKAIEPPWLLEAGPRPEAIRRVAVCGGSCFDYAGKTLDLGADVFVSSELKHATARWAEEAGLWLVDGGHFATEQIVIAPLHQALTKELEAAGLELPLHTAAQRSPLARIF